MLLLNPFTVRHVFQFATLIYHTIADWHSLVRLQSCPVHQPQLLQQVGPSCSQALCFLPPSQDAYHFILLVFWHDILLLLDEQILSCVWLYNAAVYCPGTSLLQYYTCI